MLVTTLDENLKGMGIAREIVNKVQKLRKSAGLNIDDQVELFYETSSSSDTVTKVLEQHLATIRQAVKVPFLESK
jgi:isoleucyl-tRNA synthetase